ncbi:unnamed protein product [Leptosia nina]|uniref:Uncharacterized protein n=1 Tax=Leptosia nina TaxID=320188 RepID=A0AAV1J7U1_9NEOP
MDTRCTLAEPCLEKHLKGHRNSITAISYNPNEQQIASSSLDNSILLWDLRGMRSYRFQGHEEAVIDVTFSPSGKYMASASRDKTVRVWVPTVTGSTGMFKAHSQTVRSVQYSADEKKILTASDDKIIKLWSSDKFKFLTSFVGHTNWVRRATMSQDCTLIASCSDDKTIRLWNTETGSCIHTYKDQKTYGVYVAWHPSNCYIAVGTMNGNVKLYDIRTHNLVQYYSIHSDSVNQVAYHPSGSYILTASKDGTMKILDLLEGHPLFTLNAQAGGINAVTFSASGSSFASAGEDKLVYIWKTNFAELYDDAKENINNAISLAKSQVSKDSTASKGKRQGVKIWYQCYHNTKYPVTTFLHVEDVNETVVSNDYSIQGPNAHSTLLGSPQLTQVNVSYEKECPSGVCSNNIGDMSHIPRTPPIPANYTIPSILHKSVGTYDNENIFGIIKLGDNDVCYTSGTIEWVGRKRSFPINSGFKILNKSHTQPFLKRTKKHNTTFTIDKEKIKECDCADVLPTVNAIVDHLNALHEAVDIVDLRLNTIEDGMGNND